MTDSVTDDSVTDDSVTDGSVTDGSVTDDSVTDDSVTDDSVTDDRQCNGWWMIYTYICIHMYIYMILVCCGFTVISSGVAVCNRYLVVQWLGATQLSTCLLCNDYGRVLWSVHSL